MKDTEPGSRLVGAKQLALQIGTKALHASGSLACHWLLVFFLVVLPGGESMHPRASRYVSTCYMYKYMVGHH